MELSIEIDREPTGKNPRIRYRISGVLQEVDAPAKDQYNPMVARIKTMADIDIAEKRLPQDGRIGVQSKDGKEYLFKVSTFPTRFVEAVTLRLFNRD